MDQNTFYANKAQQNLDSSNLFIPEPEKFGDNIKGKSRVQVAYEMLVTYAPFNNLLDVGCGNLKNLINLQNLFKKGFGVDIAAYPSWTPLAEKFNTGKHNLDAGPLPFDNAMFDAVTILMVLEHVFDPFTAVEEIARVTKPNGYLVINVPNIAYLKHRLGLLVGCLPVTSTIKCWEMREWDGGHIHYFTLKRLIWLLEKFGGYKVIDVQSSGKFGALKKLLPGLLCSDLQLLCQKK